MYGQGFNNFGNNGQFNQNGGFSGNGQQGNGFGGFNTNAQAFTPGQFGQQQQQGGFTQGGNNGNGFSQGGNGGFTQGGNQGGFSQGGNNGQQNAQVQTPQVPAFQTKSFGQPIQSGVPLGQDNNSTGNSGQNTNRAAANADEAEYFRKEKHIRILANKEICPDPIQSFEDLSEYNVPEHIYKNFLQNQMGFDKPSPIQSQTWSVALSGKDMIGIAETGSGKTLSFLLPGAIKCLEAQKEGYGLGRNETGPMILVLAPTRELAQQIDEQAQKLSAGTNGAIRSTVLVGGVPKGPQARELRYGKEIVIATPGRLLDLLDDNRIGFSLHRVQYLCLDEADRMLDMGFEKDIRRVKQMLAHNQTMQTMLFSATWPKEVQNLAHDLCNTSPVHIHVGEHQLGELKANSRITQNVEMIDSYSIRSVGTHGYNDIDSYKVDRIQEILREETARKVDKDKPFKTIIFCMTKKGADWVQRRLQDHGALAIHGDKSQQERDWTLNHFKSGTDGHVNKNTNGYAACNVLVATDVAARGLDIKNVELVINYDFPLNIEDYVHRIGRTGRAGNYGVSYSFFCKDDLKTAAKSAFDLVGIMSKAGQNISSELQELADRGSRMQNKGHPRYGNGGNKGKGKSNNNSGSFGASNQGGNGKGNGKSRGGPYTTKGASNCAW